MSAIGQDIAKRYENGGITSILTMEASWIAVAFFAAAALGVDMVLKKQKSLALRDDCYCADIYSYTKQQTYQVRATRKYLVSQDQVFIADDFFVDEQASAGLVKTCHKAGTNVVAVCAVIEKNLQKGASLLEAMGMEVYSLARIDRIENGQVFSEAAEFFLYSLKNEEDAK